MTTQWPEIVMLGSTNFAGASWTPYTSSNITANLGTNQGWHTVWVALSGGSQQAWNAVRLDLDLTAPILVVTNATNVTIPMIQLQGYANDQLAWLTYDLNNSNGSISNQPGFMTGAIFDTNSFTYTNNSFKCFDLMLASGANTVTLHAADLAGNSTNFAVTFNLNYSNKPAPVVQLWWPVNGTLISGSSFTWRGTVDDPTVTLSAQITDTNGDTNVVAGVIERNGNFWVDNIPLAPGTNWLTLTATDINNNTNTTNIFVVQSSVALNITYIDPITTQSAITVSGTINLTNYTVWVNGVMATNFPWDGNDYPWTAYNVPVNGAGTAVIQASAIPDSETNGLTGGGGGTNSSLSDPGNPPVPDAAIVENAPDKATVLYCSYFYDNWFGGIRQYWIPNFSLMSLEDDDATFNWFDTRGGSTKSNFCTTVYGTNGMVTLQQSSIAKSQWATNGLGTTQYARSTNAGCGNFTNLPAPSGYIGTTSIPCLQGNTLYSASTTIGNTDWVWSSVEAAASTFRLQTGGRSLPVHQSLHAIEAQAQEIAPYYDCDCQDWYDNSFYEVSDIPSAIVTILGLPQNADGFVWAVLPDGEDVDVTPKAPGVPFYLCDPAECKYTFTPYCQSSIPMNHIRSNIGVGEFLNLSFEPNTFRSQGAFAPFLPTNTLWSASAGGPAQTNWPDIVFIAPSNAANVTITTQLRNGQTLKNNFNVLEPTGVTHVELRGVDTSDFDIGIVGAGMFLTVYFGPTNVSFGRVYGLEVGEDATNVWGYYTNFTADDLSHSENGADDPIPIMPNNSWYHAPGEYSWDCASDGGYDNPGYGGGYTWRIPGQWTVGDAGEINNFPTNAWWSQTFTLSANGDLTVAKFGWSVTRGTNGLYKTNSVGR